MCLRNRCVLVVDSDIDTRGLFTALFEEEGANVVAVGSGSEALQALRWLQPDAVLCDLILPEIDGWSLIRTIRTAHAQTIRQIPAIVVTALAGEHIERQALAAGFQSYVTKPVDLDDLVAAIAGLTDLEQTNRFQANPDGSHNT